MCYLQYFYLSLVTIFPDYTAEIKCNYLFILFPHPWSDAACLCRVLQGLGTLTLWAGSQTLLPTAPGHPPWRDPRPEWWRNWTRCPLSHGSRWSSHQTGSCAVGRRSTWKLRLCLVCTVFTHCQLSAWAALYLRTHWCLKLNKNQMVILNHSCPAPTITVS